MEVTRAKENPRLAGELTDAGYSNERVAENRIAMVVTQLVLLTWMDCSNINPI